MGKIMSKLLSFSLAFVLIFATLGLQSVHANTNSDFTVGKTNREKYGVESLTEKASSKTFLDVYDGDPRDTISIIVELKDAPVIEKAKYTTMVRSTFNRETERLEDKQEAVIDEIKALDETTSVNDQFTYLTNSIAVDVKAETFDKVKALDSVKRVFVEREYYIPTPQMATSNDIVNAPNVWNTLNYKGEGMTVGVLDTGLDTDHPAFNVDPNSPKYSQADIKSILDVHGDAVHAKQDNNADLYNNAKVPFTFDYSEKRVSVKPNASNHGDVNHGTHVAGTVAGNDGADFKGVAPEAQLLIFKVFNDKGGGAYDHVITAALEDAVLLGVDSINMSLGSDNGFSAEADDYTNDLYARINQAGILVSASAGNAHSSSINNTYTLDLNLAEDPDNGIVGSPSSYNGPLSIASSENTHYVTSLIEVNGETYTYVDTNNTIKAITGEHEFVVVPNYGEVSDFENIDVTGKVALISRGEIAFTDKILNAQNKGAKGVIIFGTDEQLINMATDGTTIPSAYIVKSAADEILASGVTKLTIQDEEVTLVNPDGHLPSSFSSMGTTNTLNIKPEITAPGGQIYSALPTQGGKNYGSMSGTSMAAPHVAGGAALVKQYVKANYPTLNDAEILALMDNLLMSTANIIKYTDDEGIDRVAPVRQQGSGVMDLEKAIKSKVYLSVNESQNDDGSTRPKLELKDDVSKSGVFTLTFKVTNFGSDTEVYDINTIVTAPNYGSVNFGEVIGVKTFQDDVNNDLAHTVDGPTSVTVAPDSTETVTLTLKVDQAEIVELTKAFVNGFYVEGFVELTNQEVDHVNLNIPYLGFVGDWESAPIFDRVNSSDVEFDGTVASIYEHVLASKFGANLINLGLSVFHEDANDMLVDYDRLVVAPTNDGYFDSIDTILLGQLRNAQSLTLKVKDEAGNTVKEQGRDNAFKSFYHGNYGQIVTYTHFDGNGFDELTFDDLEDGKYTLEFSANVGLRDGVDQTLTYDIYVDRKAPEVTGVSLEDNTLKINVKDDNFILYSEVELVKVNEDGSVSKLGTVASAHTPFGDVKEQVLEVSDANLMTGEYALVVSTVDAGYNEEVYVVIPEEVSSVEDQKVLLSVGDTLQIEAQHGTFDNPTFTSEDDSIATVSPTGLITAVTAGSVNVLVEDATGNYTIEVTVVADEGLLFDKSTYAVGRNEILDLKLTFNGVEVALSDTNLNLTFDLEVLEVLDGSVKALKAGNHILKAVYTYDDTDSLDNIEEELTDSLDALQTAETAVMITVKELDKNALQVVVSNAEEVSNTVYTQESVDAYNAALEAAKVVLASETVTQRDIDNALAAINVAKADLKRNVQGLSASYDVTVGQSIQVNPVPVEGTWTYDASKVSVVRSLNGYSITGVSAGSTTLTFTNEDGVSQTITVNVKAKDNNGGGTVNPPIIDDKDQGGNNSGSTGGGKTPGTGVNTLDYTPYLATLVIGIVTLAVLFRSFKRKEQ